MDLVFSGAIIPLLNQPIIEEYGNVLKRPKFHIQEETIRHILEEIDRIGVYVDADALEIILPDAKDKVFYEVVMEKRKTEDAYLVTGNTKHFPVKPYVVTPRQMLDIIMKGIETDA